MKRLRFVSSFILIFMGVLLGNAACQTDAGFGSFGIKEFAFEVGPGSIFSPHEDIFVLDSPKSKPRRLTTGTNALFSPDGRKIVYCAHEGWGTAHIVLGQMQVVNTDGSGHKQLTNLQGGACPVDWSSDGHKIAFGGATHGVAVLSDDGESVTSILPGIAGIWSPDGSKLLFWKYRESRQSSNSIWVANGDGKDARKVIDDNTEVIELCWSPDGETILFSSERQHHGKSEIFRVRLDGSNLETFAADKKLSFFFPRISPDGRYLVVDAYRTNGSRESTILLLDLTNHSRTILAHGMHPHIVWKKP
jgi:Tol biopolymer transport system component